MAFDRAYAKDVRDSGESEVVPRGVLRGIVRGAGSWSRIVLAAVAIAACVIAVGARAEADTLLSENFDELGVALGLTSAGAFSAIDGTNIDVVGPGLFANLCAAPESGNCVDLDGTGGNPQGVLQSISAISLTPGNTYDLSFDLVGSQRGNTTSTTVTFGPYSQTFSLASNDDASGIVTNLPIMVSSPTLAFLTFTSNTPGDEGALLDNVLVTSNAAVVVSATPEPSSLALLAPCVLGLAGVVTRRRWRHQFRRL